MTVYYNEFDHKIAAWLRQLIINGDIAPGEVDERSIVDVQAKDLDGFTQHHFFSGVGVWSYALRNAGWSDDRPVWTASLPCQPFSVAGNQKGKKDDRHLLPHFIELVKQCQPSIIFGEQVESAIRHGWLDDLYTEMEAQNYAIGSAIIGAHSVNKAHIRQRIYWGAVSRLSNSENWDGRSESQRPTGNGRKTRDESGGDGADCGVADTSGEGLQRHRRPEQVDDKKGRKESLRYGSESCEHSRMGDYERDGFNENTFGRSTGKGKEKSRMRESKRPGDDEFIEWLYCRDNKYRPVKSGIKPLVNRVARGMVYSGGTIYANNTGLARTMRLKGYGNAIVAPLAEAFIGSFDGVIKYYSDNIINERR